MTKVDGAARRERVVLTGAAGRVARLVRPLLQQNGREIILTDQRTPATLGEGEQFLSARLDRARDMMRVADRATAIVHLGGIAEDVSWGKLYRSNVLGTTNVLDAARARGVANVVIASTMHVFGMYGREEPIDEDTPVRPDSRYAVSKVFAEAAGRLYAEKYGMAVTSLRIGSANADPLKAEPGLGVGGIDLARLIELCLSRKQGGYLVLHAVAPHGGAAFTDGRLADAFGFTFSESGPDRARLDRDVAAWFSRDPAGRIMRGGYFVGSDGESI